MAVQYAPQKLRVPPGFQNILEGFAREVLREQPEDIIQFGAQYFKTQLSIRDETGKDDAKKGENLEKLQKGEEVDIDLNDPEVQAAATKIQASFRGHKVRDKMKSSKESVNITEGDVEKPAKKPSTEEVDIDLNDPEVGAAALKIQASFRGHKARNEVQKIKSSESVATPAKSAPEEKEAAKPPVQDQPAEEPEAEVKESSTAVEQGSSEQPQEEEVDIDLNDPEVSKAATKIQATFRGHKTRKEIKDASPSQSKASVQASESTQEAAAVPEVAGESQETVPEPTKEDTVEAEPAVAETTEDAAPSESQEIPSESQDPTETESEKPDEEPTQEVQPAAEEGEKTEETPEGEAGKVEDAPEGEAEKVEDSSGGDAQKTEDAQEEEQGEATPVGEGEKEDSPEAEKTEDALEGEKAQDTSADAEKPAETPTGENDTATESKEAES